MERFFAQNNANVVVQSFFAPFYHFWILTQTEHLAWATAHAPSRNLAIFKMLLFFEYSAFFGAHFCTQQLKYGRTTFFCTFLAFLIFYPNWAFCMDYSPCILANFGYFQNAVIFRILGDFRSGFLHKTTLMWSYNRFLHLFTIFEFWPKLSILHRL